MLLKGIVFGVVISIVSLVVYLRWLTAKFEGPIGIDIRSLEQFLTSFFGGIGIGIGIVTVLILAADYAVRAYGRHMAGV
jgi:hypothetical protein